MTRNLINGGMLMLAPDGAGSGSAEGGKPAPANAEDSLNNAFTGDAGADGKKPADKPASGNTDAGGKKTEGEAKLAAWCEQLPPEMRGNPDAAAKLAKFQKVGDMAKAFLELEGKAASGGVPGKDATPEETASYWEKAGRPKTADGYSFSKDKENEGSAFADAAFKVNLTAAQADALFANLNTLGAARLEAARQAQAGQMKETAAALNAEYGSKYQEKMELLARGLAAAGPNVGKLLSQAGLAGNPEIIKAFIAFGGMTAESGAARGGGAGESLKSVMEGGSFDFKV
jgi:hypothetical protein